MQHGAEAGAAGLVPAGAQGAVHHSAQAAVPVSPASAVQVTKDYSCFETIWMVLNMKYSHKLKFLEIRYYNVTRLSYIKHIFSANRSSFNRENGRSENGK